MDLAYRQITKSGVSQLRTAARRRDGQPLAINLQLVDLFRYPIDKNFALAVGVAQPDIVDAFDIVLSDMKHKIKCVLATKFNQLVTTGKLVRFGFLKIKAVSYRFDEKVLNSAAYIVIEDLELLFEGQRAIGAFIDTGSPVPEATGAEYLIFGDDAAKQEMKLAPLSSSRGYYMPMYSDDCHLPDDPLWKARDIDYPKDRPFGQMTTVQALVHSFSAKTLQKDGMLPLCVRVLAKSRIFHYSKPADTAGKFNFLFHLMAGDRTGTVNVSLWTFLCPRYFESIDVGSILYLDGQYRVRKAFSNIDPFDHAEPRVEMELAFNPIHDKTPLYNVPPASIPRHLQLDLPQASVQLNCRADLVRQPEGELLDLMGIVSFVGRFERELVPSEQKYYTFRWVLLQVDVEDQMVGQVPAITLKLYTCSQPSAWDSVTVGRTLLCTKTRMKSVGIVTSRSPRRFFCMSSSLSFLWCDDADRTATLPAWLEDQPEIQAHLIRCRTVANDPNLRPTFGSLGYFYPTQCAPLSAEEFLQSGEHQFYSMDDFAKLCHDLQLYEHRTVLVQGVIAKLTPILVGGTAAANAGSSTSGKRKRGASQAVARSRSAAAESQNLDPVIIDAALVALKDNPAYKHTGSTVEWLLPAEQQQQPVATGAWLVTLVGLNRTAGIDLLLPVSKDNVPAGQQFVSTQSLTMIPNPNPMLRAALQSCHSQKTNFSSLLKTLSLVVAPLQTAVLLNVYRGSSNGVEIVAARFFGDA